MDVLLGHDVGAPGRHAAGAVVDGAEDLGAGRIGAGLQTRSLPAAGPVICISVFDGDAAVELAVLHHLPLAVGPCGSRRRCRHAPPSRCRPAPCVSGATSIGSCRPCRSIDDAGEHQMRVGVFVVDDEQAVLGRAVDRNVADIVVVVAELAAPAPRPSGSAGRRPAHRQRAGRPSAAARRRRSPRRHDACRRRRPRPRRRRRPSRAAARALSAVISASGLTVAAMAVTASEPLQEAAAREARGDELAHGRVVGRVAGRGPSFSSSWLVRKGFAGGRCLFIATSSGWVWLERVSAPPMNCMSQAHDTAADLHAARALPRSREATPTSSNPYRRHDPDRHRKASRQDRVSDPRRLHHRGRRLLRLPRNVGGGARHDAARLRHGHPARLPRGGRPFDADRPALAARGGARHHRARQLQRAGVHLPVGDHLSVHRAAAGGGAVRARLRGRRTGAVEPAQARHRPAASRTRAASDGSVHAELSERPRHAVGRDLSDARRAAGAGFDRAGR